MRRWSHDRSSSPPTSTGSTAGRALARALTPHTFTPSASHLRPRPLALSPATAPPRPPPSPSPSQSPSPSGTLTSHPHLSPSPLTLTPHPQVRAEQPFLPPLLTRVGRLALHVDPDRKNDNYAATGYVGVDLEYRDASVQGTAGGRECPYTVTHGHGLKGRFTCTCIYMHIHIYTC